MKKDAIQDMKGTRTRFRASSQAFLRSVGLALLTLIVSRSSAVTGMLRGPGGFSWEAKLPRRELVTGVAGSGESSFADFLWVIMLRRGVGERSTRQHGDVLIRGGKHLLFLATALTVLRVDQRKVISFYAWIDSSPWRWSDRPVRRIPPFSTFSDDTHRARKQGHSSRRLGSFRENQAVLGCRGPSRSRSTDATSQCAQSP